MTSGKFQMVCLVSPSEGQASSLESKLLHQNGLTGITFLIDVENKFLGLNPQIPSSGKYHEFLLDADAFPIFVGSPLKNEKTLNQFYKTAL